MHTPDLTALCVHVDTDELARQQLTVALPQGVAPAARRSPAAHHGAEDTALASRQRAEQARARRARGAGGARSYAFRRS
jgi:hypothetical protein